MGSSGVTVCGISSFFRSSRLVGWWGGPGWAPQMPGCSLFIVHCFSFMTVTSPRDAVGLLSTYILRFLLYNFATKTNRSKNIKQLIFRQEPSLLSSYMVCWHYMHFYNPPNVSFREIERKICKFVSERWNAVTIIVNILNAFLQCEALV